MKGESCPYILALSAIYLIAVQSICYICSFYDCRRVINLCCKLAKLIEVVYCWVTNLIYEINSLNPAD